MKADVAVALFFFFPPVLVQADEGGEGAYDWTDPGPAATGNSNHVTVYSLSRVACCSGYMCVTLFEWRNRGVQYSVSTSQA